MSARGEREQTDDLSGIVLRGKPLLDHDPMGRIRFAIFDPGAITPRGDDYTEPLHAWQARTVAAVMSDPHPLDDLTPQQCPEGVHPDWAVDSEDTHTCPWCEIDRLRAEAAASRAAVLYEAAEAVARFTGSDLDANAKRLRRMAAEARGANRVKVCGECGHLLCLERTPCGAILSVGVIIERRCECTAGRAAEARAAQTGGE